MELIAFRSLPALPPVLQLLSALPQNATGNSKPTQPEDSIRPLTRIRPVAGWQLPSITHLWEHRQLLGLLIRRNVQITYQQTLIGVGWAVFRPILTTAILWLVFGGLATRWSPETNSVSYPLHVLTGLTVWTLFSQSLTGLSESVVNQADLLTKVYFPRLILPIASIGTSVVDFAIQLALTLLIVVLSGQLVVKNLWALPIFAATALLMTFAVGVWLTALNVRYRDVRHLVPFILQSLFYLTPIIYPISVISPSMREIMNFNPLYSIVAGFRWSLIGGPTPGWSAVAISTIPVFIMLFSGLIYFRRTEASFADVI